jgi:hypothetical protein
MLCGILTLHAYCCAEQSHAESALGPWQRTSRRPLRRPRDRFPGVTSARPPPAYAWSRRRLVGAAYSRTRGSRRSRVGTPGRSPPAFRAAERQCAASGSGYADALRPAGCRPHRWAAKRRSAHGWSATWPQRGTHRPDANRPHRARHPDAHRAREAHPPGSHHPREAHRPDSHHPREAHRPDSHRARKAHRPQEDHCLLQKAARAPEANRPPAATRPQHRWALPRAGS